MLGPFLDRKACMAERPEFRISVLVVQLHHSRPGGQSISFEEKKVDHSFHEPCKTELEIIRSTLPANQRDATSPQSPRHVCLDEEDQTGNTLHRCNRCSNPLYTPILEATDQRAQKWAWVAIHSTVSFPSCDSWRKGYHWPSPRYTLVFLYCRNHWQVAQSSLWKED